MTTKKQIKEKIKESDKILDEQEKWIIEHPEEMIIEERGNSMSELQMKHDAKLLNEEEFNKCSIIQERLMNSAEADELRKFMKTPHEKKAIADSYELWKQLVTEHFPNTKFEELKVKEEQYRYMKAEYAGRFAPGRPLLLFFVEPEGEILFADESFVDIDKMYKKTTI